MSKRLNELFLFDIYIAILKIEKVIKNFNSYNELLYDFVSWDSVVREFSIIGEATNHLIKANILDKENRSIVNFRNVLIHKYFGIDPEEIWNISYNFLPVLKEIILEKISKIEREKKEKIIIKLIEENKHLEFLTNKLKNLKDFS